MDQDQLIPVEFPGKVYLSELASMVGKKVFLGGWAEHTRDLGKIVFIIMRDRSGRIQLTLKKGECDPKFIEIAKELTPESAIICSGTVVKAPTEQGIEVKVDFLKVVSLAKTPLPVDMFAKTTKYDTLLDWRMLDLRRPERFAVFKIESTLISGFREYLDSHGFVEIFSPVINAMATEGGAEVFWLNYFKKGAFLRQSPQLHKQMTVGAFEKVYEIGPAFRAELHHTRRHLCEFTSVDVEMAWIHSEEDLMTLQENLIRHMFKKVAEECTRELALLNVEIEIPTAPFPRISYPKAYEILAEKGKKLEFGTEVDHDAELALTEYVREKFGHDFYFLTKFPFAIRPPYHMKDSDDPRLTRSMDLIYRGLEITTGAQREHRYDIFVSQIHEKGLNPENFGKYLESFKYGIPPHGGFGLGISRLTQSLLRLENIRDAVLYPRDPERLEP
ncbi:MAG: aspartate--tRNA(Asn) ligase [Candidatus Korarchaeota archaeon]